MSNKLSYAQKDIRRAYYLENLSMNNDTLNRTFAAGEVSIELIVDVLDQNELPLLRLSDRPKYVGIHFYEGRIEIPKIERKLPELLDANLAFSELDIKVNNSDGVYNKYLINGDEYRPWIGDNIIFSVGLRNISSSYFSIFEGKVHQENSFVRDVRSFTLRARDDFEALNNTVPLPVLTVAEFSALPEDNVGKVIPFVLGDWSDGVNFIDDIIPLQIDISGTQYNAATKKVETSFAGGIVAYYVGADVFVFSIGGNHEGLTFDCQAIDDFVIKRGDVFLKTSFVPSAISAVGYYAVQLNNLIDFDTSNPLPYDYQSGDVGIVRIKIGYHNGAFVDADANAINQARMFLVTCGRLFWNTDFDVSWDIVAAKASPAQSNLATGIKSRFWIGEGSTNILSYVIGMLRQVRCDLFINSNRKFSIVTQHFEDIPQATTMRQIEKVHCVEESLRAETDKRNFFTAANANFCNVPALSGTALTTKKYTNPNAISSIGREIAKTIDMPNLYRENDVILQLTEILRFHSCAYEVLTVTVAWVHLNIELGEYVSVNFTQGSIDYKDVVMQVRKITVLPSGVGIELELLSFGNFKVPNNDPINSDENISAYNQMIL